MNFGMNLVSWLGSDDCSPVLILLERAVIIYNSLMERSSMLPTLLYMKKEEINTARVNILVSLSLSFTRLSVPSVSTNQHRTTNEEDEVIVLLIAKGVRPHPDPLGATAS